MPPNTCSSSFRYADTCLLRASPAETSFVMQDYPTSQAALSLLAFCHYSSSNFDAAASA